MSFFVMFFDKYRYYRLITRVESELFNTNAQEREITALYVLIRKHMRNKLLNEYAFKNEQKKLPFNFFTSLLDNPIEFQKSSKNLYNLDKNISLGSKEDMHSYCSNLAHAVLTVTLGNPIDQKCQGSIYNIYSNLYLPIDRRNYWLLNERILTQLPHPMLDPDRIIECIKYDTFIPSYLIKKKTISAQLHSEIINVYNKYFENIDKKRIRDGLSFTLNCSHRDGDYIPDAIIKNAISFIHLFQEFSLKQGVYEHPVMKESSRLFFLIMCLEEGKINNTFNPTFQEKLYPMMKWYNSLQTIEY